jgi:FKBP-type peptidyl-prolyl cis-trans isomerase
MKKLFVLIMTVFFAACVKDAKKCNYTLPSTSAPQVERVAVQSYLSSKGITATLHPNGFYYNVSNAGTGSKAEPCNTVSIQYTARLTNDSIFDATPGSAFYTDKVGTFLPGLQLGMSLIGKDGTVQLYIPPSLGFGSVPYPNAINPTVPANSILVYDITISAIQ